MVKNIKIVFTLFIIVLISSIEVKAQLFKLDSILVEKLLNDSIYNYLNKNSNGQNLPVLVESKVFITLFGLKDTIMGNIHLDFVTSKRNIIEKYKLKRDKRSFLFVHLSLLLVTESSVQVRLDYGNLICDNRLFKDLPLLIESNGYTLIEQNRLTGLITVKELAW